MGQVMMQMIVVCRRMRSRMRVRVHGVRMCRRGWNRLRRFFDPHDFVHVVKIFAEASPATKIQQGRNVLMPRVGRIFRDGDLAVENVRGDRNDFAAVLAGDSQVLLRNRMAAAHSALRRRP